ncbi:sporulation protein YunB [Schinkia azotoformans MEV2011]|uniref:Sporulation protein YunB n=1 Tax=Schinkia azotoformans MEV2011 TaxID=1348973 RepID=A0A072NR08_SCHAZ|nr:sporulation protein YunB [Schinkia azotoformans]KEF40094.1 sporulation protein YunB [Schinkia azotoformans MEV2011]MEC1694789.1 sporulation protein YunB [Schinkia azotoformans]MEC1716849.1 sporulation protein YunB [Schinkia azotoformans]MEC1726472.1 sporulation protein YunB [Schinkia azotoformans]MEC1743131.1 sporulation protein YunB [Schinkia azotoformans]
MAKFRRRFPRRGPLPTKTVFIITFVIFTLFTFQGLWIINKGIEPTLMSIAESKAEQFATLAINEALREKIAESDKQIEDLVIIEKSEDGRVSTIGWDTAQIRNFLWESTQVVQDYLHAIERGEIPPSRLTGEHITLDQKGIIAEIPLGQATGNVLLANLGPKIPVRFSMVGEVNTDVKNEMTEYGINNVLIKLFVNVIVKIQVIIPFKSNMIIVSTNIPIDIRNINGEVPYFYNSGEGGEPSIEAPLP